jgi:hypothetical protein
MKDLCNITLLCIDGVNPNIGVKAVKYSMREINFAKNLILSHVKPDIMPDNVIFEEIPKLTHDTYSQFVLNQLHEYVDTDYVLLINDDGFIINPHLWDDEFLKYDYIGAPWRAHYPHARVGNGGFSLRSKKFLKLCSELIWNGGHEDAECCIFNKSFFLQNGCKYAPLEVAMRFSLESKIPECTNYDLNTCFGFHGKGEVIDVFENGGQQFKDKIKLLETI